jgi:DNA polymerase-3 subunit delta'
MLLHGPAGVGKQRLALWLAQMLLCEKSEAPCGQCQGCQFVLAGQHPDLHWLFPRPKLKEADPALDDVKLDYEQAIADRVKDHGLYKRPGGSEGIYRYVSRLLTQQGALSPALAHRKVFIIGDAERMVPQASSPEAANAVLKLLEEPPANTTFILTSSEPSSLLPTIRSRVVSFRVSRLADEDVRRFLAEPVVHERLGGAPGGAPHDSRLRLAEGAPGRLLGGDEQDAAMLRAQAFLDAARGGRERWLRTAFGAGGKGARGAFSDVLDAVSVLLHERARQAATTGRDHDAVAAARAMRAVEDAKLATQTNISPQLISARLLREIAELNA